MLPSRKIYMGITGAALVALGIICMAKPMATVISLAWVIGLIFLRHDLALAPDHRGNQSGHQVV